MWLGHVAADLELNRVLNDNFNDELSEALMAIVNECREGGNSQWANAEKFKAAVNPEYRNINKKFGLKYKEFNCCRWLLFSNHTQAIPLDDDDRRVEVVINDQAPREEPGYYQQLYAAVKNPGFVNAVARFLLERDISNFDQGKRAVRSADKIRLIESSRSLIEVEIDELLADWPSDVITTNDLARQLDVEKLDKNCVSVLKRKGCERLARKVRVGDLGQVRCWAIRNTHLWVGADHDPVAKEAEKGRDLDTQRREMRL